MLGPGLQLSISGHLRTHVLGCDQAWPPVWWLELTLLTFPFVTCLPQHMWSPALGHPACGRSCGEQTLALGFFLAGWYCSPLPMRSCWDAGAKEGSPAAEFQTGVFYLSVRLSVHPSIHPSIFYLFSYDHLLIICHLYTHHLPSLHSYVICPSVPCCHLPRCGWEKRDQMPPCC